MSTITYTSVFFAVLSAVFWFWSASLKLVFPMAYLSGPPPEIIARLTFQSNLNAWAALATALSVLLQAAETLLK